MGFLIMKTLKSKILRFNKPLYSSHNQSRDSQENKDARSK